MKNSNRKSAFSLVEISIVIIIIGILVAGVTQSSRLLTQAKLSSAKSMTQSSPVASIKGISIWIDSISDASFQSNDLDDGTAITTWNDINPQTITKANLTPSGGPVYKTNIINGLPAVLFDGTDDFASTANFSNISSASTVFAVVKLPSTALAAKTIFSKRPATGTSTNIEFGTTAATGWAYSDGGASSYNPTASSSPTAASGAYVVSVVYNSSSADSSSSTATGIHFFQNGSTVPFTTNHFATTSSPNASVPENLFVGKSGLTATPAFFSGHIGELIVFDRALKKEERQAIESYLGKKWGIAMTAAAY
jgi:prepilin-type N-terminal cleavage/methylation domain-containing protein